MGTCCLAGGSGSFTPMGGGTFVLVTPPPSHLPQENRARAWTDAPTAGLLAYKPHQVLLKITGTPVFLQLQCRPEEHHVPQKATGQCQQWRQTQWGGGGVGGGVAEQPLLSPEAHRAEVTASRSSP